MSALAGLRIVEIADGACAAAAGSILADLGASVVKLVSQPSAPESLRVRLHDRGKTIGGEEFSLSYEEKDDTGRFMGRS